MEQGKKLKASDVGATRTILLLSTGTWFADPAAPSAQTGDITDS